MTPDSLKTYEVIHRVRTEELRREATDLRVRASLYAGRAKSDELGEKLQQFANAVEDAESILSHALDEITDREGVEELHVRARGAWG